MEVSVREDCFTDPDTTSYDSSYYGMENVDNSRVKNRKLDQAYASSTQDTADGIIVLETKGSNMFKELNIRRRKPSKNKQNSTKKEDQDGRNINGLLSTEILIKIFSYLHNPREISRSVLPVCRLWYKLGNDSVLWKSLEFSHKSTSTHKIMVDTVKLRCQFLRTITLKNFRSPHQTEMMIKTLIDCCSVTLSEVRLFNCQFHSSLPLVNLGKSCPGIRSLCLVRCDSNYRKSTHYRASYMKDASFLSAFTNLNTLCLFRTLAPATLSFDDAQTIVRVGGSSIKRLLLDCDFYARGIRFIISSLAPNLEVLWLQGRNYNDAMCQDISKCNRLKNLCLRHAQNITSAGLKALGRLQKIEKLLLFNTSKLSVSELSHFLSSGDECAFQQSLKYLNLSGSKYIFSQPTNKQHECDNREKYIMEGTIRTNCPNIEHVVIEKELVRIESFDCILYPKVPKI